MEESKAEHTPLSEDRPYVPLSVYQSSDIVANSTGRALLARAVETNRRDVVQFLLSRGLDVNDEYMGLLHASVWAGQWFATVLLLDCGADVDVRATDRRRTPLMRAADRTRGVRAEVMPAHLAMQPQSPASPRSLPPLSLACAWLCDSLLDEVRIIVSRNASSAVTLQCQFL